MNPQSHTSNMKDLTTKERLQVFMLYPNAKRLVKAGPKIEYMGMSAMELIEKEIRIDNDFYNSQLLLKELSLISEEEKRELARIAKVEEKHADDCVIGMRSPHRLEHTWIFRQSTIQSIVDAADYLRSRNYSLPFRGIDLFESGIAIPEKDFKKV